MAEIKDKELNDLIDSTLGVDSLKSQDFEEADDSNEVQKELVIDTPEIIDVKESDPLSTGGFRLKKATVYIIVGCVIALFLYSAMTLSHGGKTIVSLDSNNFYYIYSVEEDGTVTLLIPSNKIPEEMKELIELEDGEAIDPENPQLLIVPGVELSEEAKANVVITNNELNAYGLHNLYTYEEGYGIFKHKGQEYRDTLYLYTETAKRLGLMTGELNYDYVDNKGNIISGDEGGKEKAPESTDTDTASMPDLSAVSGQALTEEEFARLQESLAAEGYSLGEASDLSSEETSKK